MTGVFYAIVGILMAVEIASAIANVIMGGTMAAVKVIAERIAFLILSLLFSAVAKAGIYDLITKAEEGEGIFDWLSVKLKNVFWGYAGLAMAVSGTIFAAFQFMVTRSMGWRDELTGAAIGFAIAMAGLALNVYTALVSTENLMRSVFGLGLSVIGLIVIMSSTGGVSGFLKGFISSVERLGAASAVLYDSINVGIEWGG